MKTSTKLFFLASILAGCVSPADQITAVTNRASYDFNCDPAKIKITWLQAGTYGAEGCRTKQVYTVQGTQVYKEGAAPNPVYIEPAMGLGVGYHRYYR